MVRQRASTTKCNKMTTSYKINRLKEAGYDITRLGKHIKACKKESLIIGSVNKVFKIVFGY